MPLDPQNIKKSLICPGQASQSCDVHNKNEVRKISLAMNYSIRMPTSFSSSCQQKKKVPSIVCSVCFSEEQLRCMLPPPPPPKVQEHVSTASQP